MAPDMSKYGYATYLTTTDILEEKTEFTVSAFVRLDASATSDRFTIFSNGWENAGGISVGFSSDEWFFVNCDAPTPDQSFNLKSATANANFSSHEWHHYAVTLSDGNTLTFYIDGVRINTMKFSQQINLNNDSSFLCFGSTYNGGYPLYGDMDEIQVHEAALSADDVYSLYTDLIKSAEDIDPVVTLANPPITVNVNNYTDYRQENFEVNISNNFTFTGEIETESKEPMIVFAKGDKIAGHYEVWLQNGNLAFYAPEIANGDSVVTSAFVADGNFHKWAISYNGSQMKFYLDGVLAESHNVSGTVSEAVSTLSIGSGVNGEFVFNGTIGNIAIYNKCLSDNKIKQLIQNDTEPEGLVLQYFKDGVNCSSSTALKNLQGSVKGNIGDSFTVSCVIQTTDTNTPIVLFAKGHKTTGHYELWLNEGKPAFYAPELNNDVAVYTNNVITDGKMHHIAVTYDGAHMLFYIDGLIDTVAPVTGVITDTIASFNVGALVDGGYAYTGYLENVCVYNTVLTLDEILETIPDTVELAIPDTPEISPAQTNSPQKYNPTHALRGADRLNYLSALPYMDYYAVTGYEGSISKSGDNADWDWWLYDDNGEYVLFETDGAGCIYNLTQHRYPTSEEPIFRFYIDGSTEPALEIKQSEFWELIAGGVYEGPADGGRGPIWVIRNFTPISFTSHCKITSSVKLLGNDKSRGEGGWGHVTYTLYDTPTGVTPYSAEQDLTQLEGAIENVGYDPKYNKENIVYENTKISIPANETVSVFRINDSASLGAVKLSLSGNNAMPAALSNLRIRIYWDGHTVPDVDAPIGTFFGNEYGYTDCNIKTLMLGMNMSVGKWLDCYNYFPMPFWSSAKIELYNVGASDITVDKFEVQVTPTSVADYDADASGYFTSSDYYEVTENIYGVNSTIATVNGTGFMVYGVLTGYGISDGCEGDVRVFFDGRRSPEIESDGSESWASYGWGFVTPPQCNAFSSYNGKYWSNSDWSEMRLTIGDSYFFKNQLVFELEHGGVNQGLGSHSGQIFCYMMNDTGSAEKTDSIDVSDAESLSAHNYTVTGNFNTEELNSSYANGWHYNNFSATVQTGFNGEISFDVNINSTNSGVMINRTSSQATGRHAAKVFVDGEEVTERYWYYADYNNYCKWLDDYFIIPAKYTEGKESITVTLVPFAADGTTITWNHSKFDVYSLKANVPDGYLPGDLNGDLEFDIRDVVRLQKSLADDSVEYIESNATWEGDANAVAVTELRKRLLENPE